jgi:hypothetical protein
MLLHVLQSSVHCGVPVARKDELLGSEEKPSDRETMASGIRVERGNTIRAIADSRDHRSERKTVNRK